MAGFTVGGGLSTDVVPSVPLAAILAPLANNGGPTRTHALVARSPAVDAGGPDCSAKDQRGIVRPQGRACDIGAYELDLVATLKLAPVSATRLTLEQQCVTVTAANSVGVRAPNVDVDFVRTGANPGTETVETNSNGQAQHCWTGVNGGTDSVTARFENIASNTSVISWNKRYTSVEPAAVIGVLLVDEGLIRIAPRATLRDTATGAAIVGRSVQFSAGTAPLCTAVTNSSGVATCNASISSTLQSTLALGYTASFSGDSSYRPVSKKGPLVSIRVQL